MSPRSRCVPPPTPRGPAINVTIVGSGNGGLATAFDFAAHGHSVRLVDTPHLVPGEAVLICPASFAGAITFERAARLGLDGLDAADLAAL